MQSEAAPNQVRQAIVRRSGFGKPKIEIEYDGRALKVIPGSAPNMQASQSKQTATEDYHFSWEPDKTICLKINHSIHQITIDSNHKPVATLGPIYDDIYKLKYSRTYAVQLACIQMDELLFWHVCSARYKFLLSNNRIITANNLRYCSWATKCTRQGSLTRVLFSRRATPDQRPVLLAAILATAIGISD